MVATTVCRQNYSAIEHVLPYMPVEKNSWLKLLPGHFESISSYSANHAPLLFVSVASVRAGLINICSPLALSSSDAQPVSREGLRKSAQPLTFTLGIRENQMHGKCLCGSVEFEVTGNFPKLYQCHCSLCRKQGGSLSNTATIVGAENFHWLSGQEHISSWVKDTGFRSDFC